MALTGLLAARHADPTGAAVVLPPAAGTALVVRRHTLAMRNVWWIFATGFVEPVLYLLSIGVGVGALVGGFEFGGREVAYAAFVAPAMLAASAMNGAVMDSTMNVFFRLKYDKLYDQMLATPLTAGQVAAGQILFSLLRGGLYSAAFLLVMLALGLVESWWALLALPAALLIGFAFAAVGMAVTTYMRSWQDFELVQLVTMPLFMFSATFFPIETFEGWLRVVVEWSPLYRGVILCRELTTGAVTFDSLLSVTYLAAMGLAGLWVCRRRLTRLLLS